MMTCFLNHQSAENQRGGQRAILRPSKKRTTFGQADIGETRPDVLKCFAPPMRHEYRAWVHGRIDCRECFA